MKMHRNRKILALGAAMVALTIGAAPLLTAASDHIDAPAFGGLDDGAGNFAPTSIHGERDLADLYVFQGHNPANTVLVMTSNPAINLFGGKFGSNVRYVFNVDNNGNAKADVAYAVTFDNGAPGHQRYTVRRYTGANARSLRNGRVIGSGWTSGNGTTSLKGGGKAFAGVRSDPFFFDLTGFEGTVLGVGSASLGSGGDFFATLNVNAIVLEVPDRMLGRHIGVWATTQYRSDGRWKAADQVGRPAINTVFNNKLVDTTAGADKNAFNVTPPSKQRTALGGKFRANMIATLMNINAALGIAHPDYSLVDATNIANLLLPDILTYDTHTTAVGPLNGRALADDVINAELSLTTNGAVGSDGVSAHTDYLSTFPYLGPKH
ncbi:MAG: DUF4331 family protein [Candidatus Limnocylindrales bacterium]